jgi:hypothetical protein
MASFNAEWAASEKTSKAPLDLSAEYFLESLPETRASHPHLASFLVSPFRITCAQGEQRYAALVFARRGKFALFVAVDTRQFGIGLLVSVQGSEATGARQYPSLKMAVVMFLGDVKNLEPD